MEPEDYLIKVVMAYNSSLLKSESTEEINVQCSAGETKYIQIQFKGFLIDRPTPIELSLEEARPIISKITSKSK